MSSSKSPESNPLHWPIKSPPVKPARRQKGYPPQPESTPTTQLAARNVHVLLHLCYLNDPISPLYSARNRDYNGCVRAIREGADINAYEVHLSNLSNSSMGLPYHGILEK